MVKLIVLLVLSVVAVSAQIVVNPQPGGGTAAISCAGTPGNTTGAYLSQCQTAAGVLYTCNNAAGCTVAADWVAQSGSVGVFSSSAATAPAFSATPTFSLADASAKSPVLIQPGVMTASVTAVTFTNKTAGAKFSIRWTQAASGGPYTVVPGASVSNTPCPISAVASAWTEQYFEVSADGSTVLNTSCASSDPNIVLGKVSITAPTTAWTIAPAADNQTTTLPTGTIPSVIASGTTTASGAGSLNNLGSIASTACGTLTITASGVAATDRIEFTPNASIKAVVGFTPATTGGIAITAYPDSGHVNFDACNWSTGALTIGTGAVLNWAVLR